MITTPGLLIDISLHVNINSFQETLKINKKLHFHKNE